MRRVCAPRRLAPDIEAAPLLAAATSLDERAWLACPADGLGEAAVPLVAVGGTANFDHAVAGRVRATSALSPALADALASVGWSWRGLASCACAGRSRARWTVTTGFAARSSAWRSPGRWR